jgi:CheY-like chemotaxis protein
MQTCGTSEKTILVADDDRNCLSMITTALQESGHQVATAANGIEALEQLRMNPSIAIVITDIVMPEKEGGALIRPIRRLIRYNKNHRHDRINQLGTHICHSK